MTAFDLEHPAQSCQSSADIFNQEDPESNSSPLDPDSNEATKKEKPKLAPRSSLQFKVGPPFTYTIKHEQLYITTSNTPINPVLSARIDRGFDFIENDWVGYKRNYFTLVACFRFDGESEDLLTKSKFHILDRGVPRNVCWLSLRMTSRCDEDGADIPLVQHTAKRDRGPQTVPTVRPAAPGKLPSHEVVRRAANIRNDQKINSLNQLFYSRSPLGPGASKKSIFSTYPVDSPPEKVAKFERIQFSSIDLNKRTSMSNKHSILEVSLLANLDNGEVRVLACIQSPPLVVRGRSPSNYQLAKKEMMARQRSLAIQVVESHRETRQKGNSNIDRRLKIGFRENDENTYSTKKVSDKAFEINPELIQIDERQDELKKKSKLASNRTDQSPLLDEQSMQKSQGASNVAPEACDNESPLSMLSLDATEDVPSDYLLENVSASHAIDAKHTALDKGTKDHSQSFIATGNEQSGTLNLEDAARKEFEEFKTEMRRIRAELFHKYTL